MWNGYTLKFMYSVVIFKKWSKKSFRMNFVSLKNNKKCSIFIWFAKNRSIHVILGESYQCVFSAHLKAQKVPTKSFQNTHSPRALFSRRILRVIISCVALLDYSCYEGIKLLQITLLLFISIERTCCLFSVTLDMWSRNVDLYNYQTTLVKSF